MYRIAICDDNIKYLELLSMRIQSYCSGNGIEVILDCYSDSSQLDDLVDEKKMYDAYILDIEMPSVSGIKLAEQIRAWSEDVQIIFLTAYESYALKACNIHVLKYLLKEQLDQELPDTLRCLFDKLRKQDEQRLYRISNQRKYVCFNHRDIIYIRKEQKNAVFVLEGNKEEQERITLQDLLKNLNDPELYLAERSLIININHIRKIVESRIYLTDGHELVIGKNNLADLKQYLNHYWSSLT